MSLPWLGSERISRCSRASAGLKVQGPPNCTAVCERTQYAAHHFTTWSFMFSGSRAALRACVAVDDEHFVLQNIVSSLRAL